MLDYHDRYSNFLINDPGLYFISFVNHFNNKYSDVTCPGGIVTKQNYSIMVNIYAYLNLPLDQPDWLSKDQSKSVSSKLAKSLSEKIQVHYFF